jgi:hypothetical protein
VQIDEYGDGGSIYVNALTPDDAAATSIKNADLIAGIVEVHRRSAALNEDGKVSFFVRATFDYTASDSEEISFKQNDILQVIAGQWYIVVWRVLIAASFTVASVTIDGSLNGVCVMAGSRCDAR